MLKKKRYIYDIVKSLMIINYDRRNSIFGDTECCNCGLPRSGGRVFCEQCMSFWQQLKD